MKRRSFIAASGAGAASAFISPVLVQAAVIGSSDTRVGVNLSGMEWNGTVPGFSNSRTASQRLYHGWTPPTAQDVSYLVRQGFKRIRLPLSWELLQPVLYDTPYTTAGQPGELELTYLGYITAILDACAFNGIKCVLDLHNYMRYVDYLYQSNGVIPTGLIQNSRVVYVADANSRITKIMGADGGIGSNHLADIWSRLAVKYVNHPGLGGYGLMNEPVIDPVALHPSNAEIVSALQAAITAIRNVDKSTAIYVPGDRYSTPVHWNGQGYGAINPSYPLSDPASNLIYEAHIYLDHQGSGSWFDWDFEITQDATPFTTIPIQKTGIASGTRRLKYFTDWLIANNAKGALTEIGMPADSIYWQQSYLATVKTALAAGLEFYAWSGGRHWSLHNAPLSMVPSVAQGRHQPAQMMGPSLAAANVDNAVLFDVGGSYASGGALNITIYARGNLTAPVVIGLSDGGAGGTFGVSSVTLAAGPNTSAVFVYRPPVNAAATITYSASGRQVPPPRRVYSIANPVAYAQNNLNDAARCILAKYRAVEYLPANSFQDFPPDNLSMPGTDVCALWDSGYGASTASHWTRFPGNELGVVQWMSSRSPKLQISNGKVCLKFSGVDGQSLRRKLRVPTAFGGVQSNPSAVAPFNVSGEHFVVSAFNSSGIASSGAVWALCNTSSNANRVEIVSESGVVSATWVDNDGKTVKLKNWSILSGKDVVASLVSGGSTSRKLRVNGVAVASDAQLLSSGYGDHVAIGASYENYSTNKPFDGCIYGVIYGAGVPSDAEIFVLEKYLNQKIASPVF